jgi:Zn-dependent protease with chaperone function
MMAVAGLVLFVSLLAVLEQMGWGRAEGLEPLFVITVVAIFGTGTGIGAFGAYLAFSRRRAG